MNSIIDLIELLRVIQLYNAGQFSLQEGTEDGYLPGGGVQNCCPHDADYAPQDWSISLGELLRTIQFFAVGGYTACPLAGTEDGFCPNAA